MAYIAQRRDEGFSEQALANMTGIDRDHVVNALRQVFEGEIARTHIDRRRPDHRDRFHAAQNFADVVVGVGVMVHLIDHSLWTSLPRAKRRSKSRLRHSGMVL